MLKFFQKRKKDSKRKLESLLGDYELPSFPTTVMNVLTALRNPDISSAYLAKLLEADPGLHVKVLKMVNSAAFGLSRKVSNIHHAITLLGRSRLETIVLSQAVNKVLPDVDMPLFDIRQFWLFSSRRASLARVLAHNLHPTTEVESFTAGLLLDMALPILVTLRKKEYETILERWNTDKESNLNEIETELLGYDHSFVGVLIAEKWNLPEYIINAIAGHHGQEKDIKAEPAIELVSNIRGDNEDEAFEKLAPICIEKYNMSTDMVMDMVKAAFEYAEELSEIMK